MPAHQYVQHDWPPALWALLLLVLATVVVIGMGLFLWGAARPKHSQFSGEGAADARTARS
ncbi:hypothetical protein [Nocardioides baculatus]|uniref:Uncharacterized protein n=1 Tax=Nocardioides baculatus TaxID=2801337 RepID=A0ABS1L3X1_9ACTN|nr:hypothetical protein [Nocardioides baculatus]MBL0746385.1 hypothetical protein [Nocardioides baculatus]